MNNKSQKYTRPEHIHENIVLSCLNTQYQLDSIDNLVHFDGGTENTAWSFGSRQGNFMVKVYGSGELPVTKINDELLMFDFLNRNGVRAPRTVPTKDKQKLGSIFYNNYEYPTCVMKTEAGQMQIPSTITQTQLTAIGFQVAKLHKVLQKYHPTYQPISEQINTITDASKVPNDHHSAFEALIQSVQAKAFNKSQLAGFADIDQKMEIYLKQNPLPQNLINGLIHNDLALEHARILSNGDVYFFDFCDRQIASYAQELGSFIAMLYQWEDISFEHFEQLQKWFLSGYQSANPLPLLDLQTIPYFIISRILGTTKYLCMLAKDKPSKHVVNWVRRGYELGEYYLKLS